MKRLLCSLLLSTPCLAQTYTPDATETAPPSGWPAMVACWNQCYEDFMMTLVEVCDPLPSGPQRAGCYWQANADYVYCCEYTCLSEIWTTPAQYNFGTMDYSNAQALHDNAETYYNAYRATLTYVETINDFCNENDEECLADALIAWQTALNVEGVVYSFGNLDVDLSEPWYKLAINAEPFEVMMHIQHMCITDSIDWEPFWNAWTSDTDFRMEW